MSLLRNTTSLLFSFSSIEESKGPSWNTSQQRYLTETNNMCISMWSHCMVYQGLPLSRIKGESYFSLVSSWKFSLLTLGWETSIPCLTSTLQNRCLVITVPERRLAVAPSMLLSLTHLITIKGLFPRALLHCSVNQHLPQSSLNIICCINLHKQAMN